MPKYNVQKFAKLQRRAQQLSAASKSAYDEKKYCNDKLRAAQAKIDNLRLVRGESVPESLEIELEEAKTKYQEAHDARLEAQQASQEVGQIVSRCENFLHDHGIKVGKQNLRITS